MNLTSILQIIVIGSLLVGVDFLILTLRRKGNLKDVARALGKVVPSAMFSIFDRLKSTPSPKIEGQPDQMKDLPALATPSEVEFEASSTVTTTGSMPADEKRVRVHVEAEVPPDTVLTITISTDREGHLQQRYASSAPRHPARTLSLPNPLPFLRRLASIPLEKLTSALFVLALLTYLLTRLIGLTDFPIYFFGDEAIQTTTAFDLVQRGMRGPDGALLPTYFQNGLYFNLSTSVYLQIIPLLLFGKSIFVTRATSVLVTVLAAICVGWMLNYYFATKHWWLATLLLSIIPAWFLHSRTAFETAIFVSFYAAFLYFYLGYRLRNPNQVYWAAFFAGLAFYSYSPGQLVLAVTGILLFFSDLKYHWQQRLILIKATGLLVVIALPYLRFRWTVEYSPLDHLRTLGSYWIQPIPIAEKLTNFLSEYLYGLSPRYWFFEAFDDRHQMRGYGNLPLWFTPFLAAGIVQAVWRWRSPAHRLALLTLLAAPSGAALAGIGITRVLVLVIPASLLTALGLSWFLEGIGQALEVAKRQVALLRRPFFSEEAINKALALSAFVLLAGVNIYMLRDALLNGPTWYTNYGLYGMQYGAKQIFQETVVPALQQDPEAQFTVSPSWANGAEHFAMFFVPDGLRERFFIGQIYDFLDPPRKFSEKDYYVVTAFEFEKISADPKFKQAIVRSIIPYPDGTPGFYILNIQVADNIDEILAADQLAAITPIEKTIQWMGQPVRVRYLPLGGGFIENVVDGDIHTLARGEQANPFTYEFFFSQPVSATELVLTTGSMGDFSVFVQIYAVDQTTSVNYEHRFTHLGNDPTVHIPFSEAPARFDHIVITIQENTQPEYANIHVWEIELR